MHPSLGFMSTRVPGGILISLPLFYLLTKYSFVKKKKYFLLIMEEKIYF